MTADATGLVIARCVEEEYAGDYDMIFGRKVQRTVMNNYTVRYDTKAYQITKLRGAPLRVCPQAKIDVYLYLDRRIKMLYKGEELCIKEVAA